MSNLGAEFRLIRTFFANTNAFLKLHFGGHPLQSSAAFPVTHETTFPLTFYASQHLVSNFPKNQKRRTISAASSSVCGLANFQNSSSTSGYRHLHNRSSLAVPQSWDKTQSWDKSSWKNRAVRMYSTNNRDGGNEPRTEMKGVVVHIPHPIDWLKNLWYMFIVQGWLDSSFNRQDFLYGAKQAVCHLTRLAVLKDFDGMKSVASTDVVHKMKEIVSTLSLEQLQSIEILPENINLAKFSVSSVSHRDKGSFAVSIDVFCLAIRMFQSQPLLIQTIIRFCRDYEHETQSDWRIDSIQEFNIKELGSTKDE